MAECKTEKIPGNFPKFGILKMALRNVLRKHPEIHDIIVHGTYFTAEGLDLALIVGRKDLMSQSKVIKELGISDINLVPLKEVNYFEEFLEFWSLKYVLGNK